MIRPWTLLNLLCLDAPLVAIAWQWQFSRSFGLPVNAATRTALFLTAWFIYLSDRVADSFTIANGAPRSLRQEFCRRHRGAALFILPVIAAADVWVVGRLLDRTLWPVGAGIAAVAIAYLALNHSLGAIWSRLPFKEGIVGMLFAAGTLVFALPHRDIWNRQFGLAAGLFALLCALNCIAIADWERSLDRAQGKISLATRWPKIARKFTAAAFAIAAVSCATAAGTDASAAPFILIAISAALLLALDLAKRSITRDTRTALADLVLLTPALSLFSR